MSFEVNQEKVDQILADNPKAEIIEGDDGEVFVVDPSRGCFLRYEDGIAAGKLGFANESFIRDATLYPEREVLDRWLKDNRAAAPSLVQEIQALKGGNKKFKGKSRRAGA